MCYINFILLTSVSCQLSQVLKSNGLSLRVIIPQTFGFHYSIVHSFVTFNILETKFYGNDIITVSVTSIKLMQVKHQSSPMAINS